jgi:hypothetical protein
LASEFCTPNEIGRAKSKHRNGPDRIVEVSRERSWLSRFQKTQNLPHGILDPRHQGIVQTQQGTVYEPRGLDSEDLVDHEIRVLTETASGRNPNAQWLGIIYNIGGKWYHERKRMLLLQEFGALNDQNLPASGPSGPEASSRARRPDFAALNHSVPRAILVDRGRLPFRL